MPAAQHSLSSENERLASFVIEQCLYFSILANNVGLSTQLAGKNKSDVLLLTHATTALLRQSTFYGFMFGEALDLINLVPKIAAFARKQMEPSATGSEPEIQQAFATLEMQIMNWTPSPAKEYTLIQSSDDFSDMSVGLLWQLSLLVFLRAARCGPGLPPVSSLTEIEQSIHQFMRILRTLSLEASSWSVLLWPILISGSCIWEPRDQAYIGFALHNSGQRMHAGSSVLKLLQLLWQDESYYVDIFGPYGIGAVTERHGLELSLG